MFIVSLSFEIPGLPMVKLEFSVDRITFDAQPIMLYGPIFMPSFMVALIPIKLLFPIFVYPPNETLNEKKQ